MTLAAQTSKFNELIATPGFNGVCVNVLKSWGFSREAAIQEGYYKVWVALTKDVVIDKPLGFVTKALTNVAKDIKRLNANKVFFGSSQVHDDYVDGSEYTQGSSWIILSSDHCDHDRFESLICDSKEPHKEVLRLYYRDNAEYEDIAEQLGISEGTVKSRMSRARKQVAAKYDQKR